MGSGEKAGAGICAAKQRGSEVARAVKQHAIAYPWRGSWHPCPISTGARSHAYNGFAVAWRRKRPYTVHVQSAMRDCGSHNFPIGRWHDRAAAPARGGPIPLWCWISILVSRDAIVFNHDVAIGIAYVP